MKYIVFEDFSEEACPILFPNRIRHLEMREQMPYGKVLSAGYVDLRGGSFVCHGMSRDLNMGPGADDARILEDHFLSQED